MFQKISSFNAFKNHLDVSVTGIDKVQSFALWRPLQVHGSEREDDEAEDVIVTVESSDLFIHVVRPPYMLSMCTSNILYIKLHCTSNMLV